MEGLGRLFDISIGSVPADAVAAAVTGKRVSLRNAAGCTIVVVTTGTSTDVLDVDLQQHTAASGGSPLDLDIIDHYYYKSAATLAGTETWTKGTQTAASEITNVGAASQELILVIEVEASKLADGYKYISLDVPDQGSNATKHVAVLYLLRDLEVQRAPANLAAPLS